MIKRSKKEINNQIRQVMADYIREPSDRTLGYLGLLINFYDTFSKPIDFMDKPINELPITEMDKGRTDTLEWLHDVATHKSNPTRKSEIKEGWQANPPPKSTSSGKETGSGKQ
jgi:hypothetical protein